MGEHLCGSVTAFVLYDVCEEMRLDQIRSKPAARTQEKSLKHQAPEYVGFQRPPVVESLEPLRLESGETLSEQIKYYDYGVISVMFERRFEGDWEQLVQLAAQWLASSDLERTARNLARQQVAANLAAMVKPYKDWLVEDYFIFHLWQVPGCSSAVDLMTAHGDKIAQIVRGENIALSAGERHEVLQSSISYYPTDVAIVGWNAAFVYDTPAGATTAMQILEFANSQLLEFRHYDQFLDQELAGVYRSLEYRTGLLKRWRMRRAASQLQATTIEVTELTERADNAIKFLSDMFSARLYKLAAAKVGVPDYKNLVQEKLATADQLYRFLVEEFNQTRAFILELTVVIILVIELAFLFRGKS